MSSQIGNIQIHQICIHMIKNWIDYIHAIHKLSILVGNYMARFAIFDEFFRVERVHGRKLVDTREHHNGDAVNLCRLRDSASSGGGDE